MNNTELVKCLEWLKANYPDDYNSHKDNDYDRDREYITTIIVVKNLYISFKFNIPMFSKQYGFTWFNGYDGNTIKRSSDYIQVSVEDTDEDGEGDYNDNIDTLEEFIEAFNSLIK